jgi:hypothetical protein
MPFRSEKQRRFLWSQHPDIAEAWAHGKHTAKSNHKMPSRSGRSKTRRSRRK